jgi:hypothetical protein
MGTCLVGNHHRTRPMAFQPPHLFDYSDSDTQFCMDSQNSFDSDLTYLQRSPRCFCVWGENMRQFLLCTTVSATLMSAGSAFAGGMAEPVMEPAVVEQATSSSSQDIVIPLLLLLVILAATTGGDAPVP